MRSEVDHERRLVRYRGRPQVCNYCPAKTECTDSDEGREVVHAIDPWPHSEAGRFHRGISLAVTLVAGLILAAEILRHHAPSELAVLVVTLVVVALRSEEHTSELQSRQYLVCRLLLEKKKKKFINYSSHII